MDVFTSLIVHPSNDLNVGMIMNFECKLQVHVWLWVWVKDVKIKKIFLLIIANFLKCLSIIDS